MRTALFNSCYQMSLPGWILKWTSLNRSRCDKRLGGGRARGSHILCPVAGAGGTLYSEGPPIHEQTDMIENIPFPQLHWPVVINCIWFIGISWWEWVLRQLPRLTEKLPCSSVKRVLTRQYGPRNTPLCSRSLRTHDTRSHTVSWDDIQK